MCFIAGDSMFNSNGIKALKYSSFFFFFYLSRYVEFLNCCVTFNKQCYKILLRLYNLPQTLNILVWNSCETCYKKYVIVFCLIKPYPLWRRNCICHEKWCEMYMEQWWVAFLIYTHIHRGQSSSPDPSFIQDVFLWLFLNTWATRILF